MNIVTLMVFDDQELIQNLLAFVRERGQVSVAEIRERFSPLAVVYAGWMVAQKMLTIVSGGGEEDYVVTLFD